MSDCLRLPLVQADFSAGTVEENLSRVLSFHAAVSNADLLVLPEGVL